MQINIRLIYLYLFSFVGLLVTVIGCVRLVDLGLKIFVFPDADRYDYYAARPIDAPGKAIAPDEEKRQEEEFRTQQEKDRTRQRQRDTAGALSMIIVGVPLYIYHWKTIQRENHKKS